MLDIGGFFFTIFVLFANYVPVRKEILLIEVL